MKIYLASTAPSHDGPGYMIPTPRRLLSYFYILKNGMNSEDVFKVIKAQRKKRKRTR